ncbi:hypothetical protein PIB30_079645 [Stylosanthes scabra]|uniref:Uncharacterized protein n=1 Tax=Stylosanthes scabra TaxID=79078 RepID=A0ABU6ZPY2_9FABA|nr:hypothetical protein [Stylosanthes scabra]
MEDKVMEFYAEVRHAGCSSSFRPFVPPMTPAPSQFWHWKMFPCGITTPGMIQTMRRSPRIIARRKMRRCRTPRLEGLDSSYWHRCPSLSRRRAARH